MPYTEYEIMHAAIKVLDRRSKHINREDELYHYGRKGMKWGEDIFAQDEESKRRAGKPQEETGAQRAARLKKELLLRRANAAAEKEGKTPYQESGYSPNPEQQAKKEEMQRRAGKPTDGETGAQRAQRLKKEALLRRTEAAAANEGKGPYKESGYEDRDAKAANDAYNKAKATEGKTKGLAQRLFKDNPKNEQTKPENTSQSSSVPSNTTVQNEPKPQEQQTTSQEEKVAQASQNISNNVIEKIDSANYIGNIAVAMLGANEELTQQYANEMDKIIQDGVKQAFKDAGFDTSDPVVQADINDTIQILTDNYIEQINVMYAALLNEQTNIQQPNPATQHWMFGM